jgi:myo-inositol-1(or 4)-monophosphatase
MTEANIVEWLEVCEAAARAGGRELVKRRGKVTSREKGRADLVTDADYASQAAIRDVIFKRFPDHAFVGEEQAATKDLRRPNQPTWIVDPLDGTTNYVHGYPHYAVSVAVAQEGRIGAGVVYDPVNDQCFRAAEGGGAWCNGERMKTSAVTDVGSALVAVSLPAHVTRDSPDLHDFIEAVQVCQAVRRSGSAALNFAHLALGSVDAFWARHIHPWDVAAGALLVREAGGVVTSRDGGSFDLWLPQFLAAANGDLHRAMLRVLSRG